MGISVLGIRSSYITGILFFMCITIGVDDKTYGLGLVYCMVRIYNTVVVVSGLWTTERNNPNTRPCMLFNGLMYKKRDQ